MVLEGGEELALELKLRGVIRRDLEVLLDEDEVVVLSLLEIAHVLE